MTSDRGSCRRDVNPFADESRRRGGCPDLPGASSAAAGPSGGGTVELRWWYNSGRRTYTQSSIHRVPSPPIMYVPCPPQPPVKCRRRTSPLLYGFPTPPGVSRFPCTRLHPPRHDSNIVLYYDYA